MTHVTAVLSLLHEDTELNSAVRQFRGESVLAWTLHRITRAQEIGSIAIVCWEDQFSALEDAAAEACAHVLAKGPRQRIPLIESIAAARRWSDGWRGGLMGACDCDRGFHGQWILEVIQKLASDAIVLVDPAAGLVDPALLDGLVRHAATRSDVELCFSQAAPGLSGVLVRPSLVHRLASGCTCPGRFLHYMPDAPAHDPISGPACAPVPTPVARTLHRFTLDSQRQIARLSSATISLNGQLVATEAEELVHRMDAVPQDAPWPREITLELTVHRATRACFRAGTHLQIARPDLTPARAARIFEQLGDCDDLRLTLAGIGDPLLCPDALAIVAAARDAGICAVHVETDLLDVPVATIEALAASELDCISVHLPAVTAPCYAQVMGVGGLEGCIENIKRLLVTRQARNRGVPLIVPTFTKCQQNLAEMEAWYDQWLRVLGTAVIAAPSDCAGQIPDCAVADMSPPRRRACRRVASRMTILSDGRVTRCEQDVLGVAAIGNVDDLPPQALWRRVQQLHGAHERGEWVGDALCGRCREWHRP